MVDMVTYTSSNQAENDQLIIYQKIWFCDLILFRWVFTNYLEPLFFVPHTQLSYHICFRKKKKKRKKDYDSVEEITTM